MPIEMDCPGIKFTVQWKKKSGTVSRQEDVTSIGLWDPDDSNLDWSTFKSYVGQNLGTVGNISVAYVDSEGDEVPIESECEFQEALKFARQCARNGQETILKVDRQETGPTQISTTNIPEKTYQEKAKSLLTTSSTRLKPKSVSKSANKSNALYKYSSQSNMAEGKKYVDTKAKSTADKSESTNVDNTEVMMNIMEKLEKMNLEEIDAPPPWFRKYMQKMKNDIVAEVTSNVVHEMQRVVLAQRDPCGSRSSGGWPLNKNKNKKKKKLSDEESSDGTLGCESRDHKLLKKIEKLHKREKKLEKKLDSKLEKLENKTKRMMEKRSQCKARCEKVPERKSCSMKWRSDMHVSTYLMDAILLNDGPASEITIYPGQHFLKVWEIMNAGTLPWTDKTELRLAWGTSGLDPEETVVKCPILQSGEQGTISMKFRAPEFPGHFKSYWHFYHMGDRFGHWIGCSVIVKDAKGEQLPELDDPHSCNADQPNDFSNDPVKKNKPDAVNKLHFCNNELEQLNSSRREEYESDFESDNLSVISVPGSESSDSDDENFVVIPMPACFVCDVPLGQAKTIPVVMKPNSTKDKVQKNKISGKSREQSEVKTSLVKDLNSQLEKRAEYEDKPLEKLYAVDSSGICIPIKCFSKSLSSHSETEETLSSSVNSEDVSSGDEKTGDFTTQNSEGNNANASNASKPPSASSLGPIPLTNVIHILPETLVTGAVNVASSAYNTACAVMSNLRILQEGDDTVFGSLPRNIGQPTDHTTDNLEKLLEMGFSNRIMNVILLQRYNNDMIKVVADLVSNNYT